ncbi:hypothetical protein CXG45_10010 [Pseudomonas plecoglossicida]|uniref:Uncharacterized protein n=1 Tax=Pseudomonas plecoglossicida TaxID=70775 RepID=A0ABX4U5X0_PSEDL|nr:hypothetical protein CXG44_11960 [Pseudomonas plecoglossicida]PLU93381.1 hypothetical protein CXG45_10010 [Pseudomonas plecoglossicida]PLV03611.1 hypothetical protein CXG48_13150 [Pseudomonas plecoglossicida]PLV16374.1 hypothetical protein CXG47_05770 [Pseudomonas plecoglossicida]TXI05909.1 MAG: hypothetical protein E6Q70_09590 [Pseudomonas monteilii]
MPGLRCGRCLSELTRWLLRGLARSHRYCAGLEICAVPVGAGKPAKRPTQVQHFSYQPNNSQALRVLA